MEKVEEVPETNKEELKEQTMALEALSQLSFDPALLSEINSIVDEAQEVYAVEAASKEDIRQQSTGSGSVGLGDASGIGSAPSNKSGIVTKKEKPRIATEKNVSLMQACLALFLLPYFGPTPPHFNSFYENHDICWTSSTYVAYPMLLYD